MPFQIRRGEEGKREERQKRKEKEESQPWLEKFQLGCHSTIIVKVKRKRKGRNPIFDFSTND